MSVLRVAGDGGPAGFAWTHRVVVLAEAAAGCAELGRKTGVPGAGNAIVAKRVDRHLRPAYPQSTRRHRARSIIQIRACLVDATTGRGIAKTALASKTADDSVSKASNARNARLLGGARIVIIANDGRVIASRRRIASV